MKIRDKIKITPLIRLDSQNQAGFSLIELMISMLVGIFLLAGVVINFTSTKDSDLVRNAISEMDANARTALNVMRQTITHAGYSSIRNVRLETPFYTLGDGVLTNPSTCGDDSSRDVYTPTENRRTRDSDNADFITVVSLADNPCRDGLASCPNAADINPDALVYYDCVGGGINRDARTVSCSTDENVGMQDPTQAKIYSSFRLLRNNSSANDRVLYCDGSRGGTQPLVDNVEAMQFLYGLQRSDGSQIYRTANQVEDNNQWGLVTSVQVGLLMRSSHQYVLKTDSSKIAHTLLNKQVEITSDQRRRLYRIYTTTINLENRNKGALL